MILCLGMYLYRILLGDGYYIKMIKPSSVLSLSKIMKTICGFIGHELKYTLNEVNHFCRCSVGRDVIMCDCVPN